MGLNLEWTAFEDGAGAFARAGGFRLIAGNGGRWVVDGSLGGQAGCEPTQAAAQEAAEAAAARLLAEDAGVRALMGLRWIPVTEGLPDFRQRVEIVVDGVIHAAQIGELMGGWYVRVPDAFCECRECFGEVYIPLRKVTHWRPLGGGPVAAKPSDSANHAAAAEEREG